MPATLRARPDASPCDAGPDREFDVSPACSAGLRVTYVFRHRVVPRIVPAYEGWLARIGASAQDAPGYLGAHVVRPPFEAGDYMFVPRFDDAAQLARWRATPRCIALLDEVARLLESPRPPAAAEGMLTRLRLPRLGLPRLRLPRLRLSQLLASLRRA